MKIDDTMTSHEISKYHPKSEPNPTQQVNEKFSADDQKAKANENAEQDTIVNISKESQEAQRIKELISSEPDIREDKVSELKERIESGKYSIDCDRVADKMIQASLEDIL
jgi:negative regulator of flagellin synthesis FlgM